MCRAPDTWVVGLLGCRIQRSSLGPRPVHWGPVARSNLRCTLASALAAALVRQQQAGGGLTQEDVAEYCSRVSEEKKL